MSIDAFLVYVKFSTDCPSTVNSIRWAGMLRWFRTRVWEQDGFILPTVNRD
jgi:hypothetical protein